MKLKLIFAILAWSLAASCFLQAEEVRVDDFGDSVVVIGKLGKPLGTIANVEGQVISDPKQGRSGQISAALRISKVDDERLPKGKIVGLVFRLSQGMPAIHAHDFVQLTCYESGAFVGTPDAARDTLGKDAQPLDWQFESMVYVIKWKTLDSP